MSTTLAQQVIFSSGFEASEVSQPNCLDTSQICNANGSSTSLADSLVEDGLSPGTIDAGGNLFTDPFLNDPDGADKIRGSLDDDLRPAVNSPALDAGNAGHLPPDSFDLDSDGNTSEPLPLDIAGTARSLGAEARPDMGAYETAVDAPAMLETETVRGGMASVQQIHYVRVDGAGGGASWADAYGSLQDALVAAQAGDQVWVAAGVYRPDTGTGLTPGDRSLSFHLPPGVRLHGGFAGSESSLAERDLATQRTILSGDLAADDDGLSLHEENSRHVVRIVFGDDSTLLESVTVSGGNADGVDADGRGGGILVEGGTPWIVNAHVTGSMAHCGGGVALSNATAAHLVNTVVNGNRAETGGGLCVLASAPSFTNATLTFNAASTGPGIYNDTASPLIANTIVSGNRVFDDLDHCELWEYPCSAADVAPEILVTGNAVMEGAWYARAAGTMADALAYLQNHPDVVETLSSTSGVGARVRGGPMEFLLDAPDPPAAEAGADPADALEESPLSTRFEVAAEQPAGFATRVIVGEDLNLDGKIDNRDGKRALVIAPFNTGDAVTVEGILQGTRNYSGQVQVRQGSNFSEYQDWSSFDFVYLATKSYQFESDDPGVMPNQMTVIATAIPANLHDGGDPIRNASIMYHSTGAFQPPEERYYALTTYYFNKTYNSTLDNAVVYCAACDLRLGGLFSEALGVKNFALAGWEGDVSLEGTASNNEQVVAELATGLDLSSAFGAIPGNAIFGENLMRVIELPLLLYPNSSIVLRDGADLSESVIGVVGDDEPDQLQLHLVLQGFGIADLPDLPGSIRIIVDGKEVECCRSSPEQLGSNAVYYDEALFLGFPLQEGRLPIEVIVAPFAGAGSGESRFSVNALVGAFDCSASATISGFRNGAFSGPAKFVLGEGPGLTLTLTSLEWAIGYDPDGDGAIEGAYEATFYLPPELDIDLTNPPVEIPLGNELINLVTSYDLRDPWLFGTDQTTAGCALCGGKLTVTSISSDNALMVGEVDFKGMEGDYQVPDISRLKATFTAASGDKSDPESPYGKCIRQYWLLE